MYILYIALLQQPIKFDCDYIRVLHSLVINQISKKLCVQASASSGLNTVSSTEKVEYREPHLYKGRNVDDEPLAVAYSLYPFNPCF